MAVESSVLSLFTTDTHTKSLAAPPARPLGSLQKICDLPKRQSQTTARTCVCPMSALTSSSSLSASFYPTRYVLAFWNAKQSRYLPSSLSFVSMDDALCAFLDGCATRRYGVGQ